jgi:hypothetical protein
MEFKWNEKKFKNQKCNKFKIKWSKLDEKF